MSRAGDVHCYAGAVYRTAILQEPRVWLEQTRHSQYGSSFSIIKEQKKRKKEKNHFSKGTRGSNNI